MGEKHRIAGSFVLLVLVLLYLILMTGSSYPLSISGYYKNYSTALDIPDIENISFYEDQPIAGSVSNRLRLNLSHQPNDWSRLELAYDLVPRIQDEILFSGRLLTFDTGISGYRASDFDEQLYPDENEPVSSFAVFHNLDRLLVTLRAPFADIYLGRQAIAWGSARIINPTDILRPFTFNELDVEDRRGIDALRVRIPIGLMSEFDAGYVFGDQFKFENSAQFLRTRLYYLRTDISLLVISFRENLLVGFDLTRAIGGAGVWLESAYVFTHALDDNVTASDDYLRSSAGVDYSLGDGTYLFCEYHYNQAGENNSDRYISLSDDIAYNEGAVYLLAEHYLAAGISHNITPLIILNGEVLTNLIDPSAYLMPSVKYNIEENFYLSGGVYFGLGKKPEFNPMSPGFIEMPSEFGFYPTMYYSSFRIYF
ncbi:MAG: hypothetical protein GF315_00620 [candidate division Zixibacteria bacterium]|nr:hypothetical protein [candidate division Zixibacteria bacterium]